MAMETQMLRQQRSRRVALATEQNRAIPMKGLLDRLGSGVDVLPWSAYLPEQLQPPELRAARAAEAARKASSSFESSLCKSVDAPSEVSRQFCLQDLEIVGRIWSLSQEAHGCRQVQQALECAPSDASREALASELHGHVVEACKCPHANHVLQKLILLLPGSSSQFVVDEMMAGQQITQMARHKYGCRIMQRLVEQCHPDQVLQLVERVLTDLSALSRHPYGTYVIQNIMEHGLDEHRRCIMKAVAKDIRVLGSEAHGCAVVSASLSHGPEADRAALAQILLREPGLLVFLASSRNGHIAALRALDLLEGNDLSDACSRLHAEAESLRNSRYGRIVVDALETTDSCQKLWDAACRAGA